MWEGTSASTALRILIDAGTALSQSLFWSPHVGCISVDESLDDWLRHMAWSVSLFAPYVYGTASLRRYDE